MHRILAALSLLVALAAPLGAETLRLAPLAEALRNPALDSGSPDAAREAVKVLLWNQPSDDEREPYHQRLAQMARHRDTRVGKLYFAALGALPDVENVPEGVSRLTATGVWPLSLGAQIRVRAGFTRRDGEWRIERVAVILEGLAAAPVAGTAPYFAPGEIDAERLDFEPVDYLAGRDPEDRILPEDERSEFDFDAALDEIFRIEEGAFAEMLDKLNTQVTPDAEAEDRIAALAPHLATEAEREALREASGEDSGTRRQFWEGIYEQIRRIGEAPRPAGVPTREDASIELEYVIRDDEGERNAGVIALRLASGEISLREEALALGIEPESEDEG